LPHADAAGRLSARSETARWCIDERKWPYDDPAWRRWLTARRNGQVAELPGLEIDEKTD
jgi:hypothetical protein